MQALLGGGMRPEPAAIEALQGRAGNHAVQTLLVQRDHHNGGASGGGGAPPVAGPDGTPIRRTERGTIENIAESIHWVLHISYSDAGRDRLLRHLIENQDRIGELQSHYSQRHTIALLDDIKAELTREDALRAYDYMTYGRLRAVSKVMLAIDGAGTAAEILWRSLTEAHGEGDAATKWSQLLAAPLPICERWRGQRDLDGALADDLEGADLDKGKALWRYGQLRPIDKIRVATNGAGTDVPLLMDGLRAADAATVRQEYRSYYNEDLDTLLFDTPTSNGELSGGDADRARALLGGASTNVDALANIVQAAVSGVNDFQLVLNAVRDAQAKVAQGGPSGTAAQHQLDRLSEQIRDHGDPLGIRSWGGLSAGEHAQLIAMLGIAETRDDVAGMQSGLDLGVLNDPAVRRLRAMGGTEYGEIIDSLMKGKPDDLRIWNPQWRDADSNFSRYVRANTRMTGGEWDRVGTILGGSVNARLHLVAGGTFGDDKEQYAYDLVEFHASPQERLELRQAMRAIDRGQSAPATPAGRAIAAVHEALGDSELNILRDKLRMARLGAIEEAEALEEDVERERSSWYGTTDDLEDARREVRAGVTTAGLDARLSPSEEANIRGAVERGQAALQTYRETRDQWTGYASTVIGIASGLLVTALTGGAAGPAVMAAIIRAAIASAAARVLTEKALNGDRFDLTGDEAVRAFGLGAVDGVMNVLSAGAASGVLSRITRTNVAAALAAGEARLGTRLVHSAIDGSFSGGISGIADSVTNEQTWQRGVTDGLAATLNAGLSSAGQGAVFSVGMTGGTTAWHGATQAWEARQARRRAAGEAPEIGPDGRPIVLPGGPDGASPGSPAASHSAGQGAGPSGLYDAHPIVALARQGDDIACRELLATFGRWEVAHAHLDAGSGPATNLTLETRRQLAQRLTQHRERLIAFLRTRGAEPLPGASTEGGSDADLNIRGDDAGRRLIDIRSYLDRYYPGWQTTYRMDLMIDASRIGSLREVLGERPYPPGHTPTAEEVAAAQARAAALRAAQARMTTHAERLLLARRLRHAEPAERAATLDRITNAESRRLVEELVNLTPEQRLARHDRALRDGDALTRSLRAATDEAERARLAEEITYHQMIANALGDEAYITPGGVHGYALGQRLTTPHERYQAVLDQIDMIRHQVAEHGGVLDALRRYELFKYMMRTCDALEQAGIRDPAVTTYRHLAELYYQMDRAAMSGTPRGREDTTGLTDRHRGGQPFERGETPTPMPNRSVAYNEADPVRPGVDEAWLLQQYTGFRDLVHRSLPTLRDSAGAGGSPLPLAELPALGPNDRPGLRRPGAPDAPTASPPATGPEQMVGLGSEEAMRRASSAVDSALGRVPAGASHEARIRAAAEPILVELDRVGAPRPNLVVQDLGNPQLNGSYTAATNTITVNLGAMDGAAFRFDASTPQGAQRLMNLLYHESRHAEQVFHAMRYDLSINPSRAPAELAAAHSVAPAIAEAAARNPFTAADAGSPAYELGRQIHQQRYDPRGTQRRTHLAQEIVARSQEVLTQIQLMEAQLASIRWWELWRRPRARELERAIADARLGLRQAFTVYRSLAEEIDAFSAGDRAQEYLRLVQAARAYQERATTSRMSALEMLESVRRLAPHEEDTALTRVLEAQRALDESIGHAIARLPRRVPIGSAAGTGAARGS